MINNKYKNWFYGIGAVVVLGGLFAYPILTDENRGAIGRWKSAGINCLNRNIQVKKHVHPTLSIIVDGENESFDRDLGIVGGCLAEFHVHHGEPGVLHVETPFANKDFVLSQFEVIYDKPLIREGYTLEATVNGEIIADPGNLILTDNQQIILNYTSVDSVQAVE